MEGRALSLQQGHAVFAPRNQQGVKLKRCSQLLALCYQLFFAGAGTDYSFEFTKVWGDNGGATVFAEVVALGVHHHRNRTFARRLDQGLGIAQRTLAIIGQNQYLG